MLKTKKFTLSFIALFHNLFTLACIFYIINYSYNMRSSFTTELLVLGVTVSFCVFKKCIMVDIYNHFSSIGGEISYENRIKKIYLRKHFGRFINPTNTEEDTIDYSPFRLDILDNIDSLFKQKNKKIFKKMMNHKIHYLCLNIIIIIIMLIKYRLESLIPVFIVWLLQIYPL